MGVDRDGESVRVIPQDQLLSQAERDFFVAARQLNEGEVYVSQLEPALGHGGVRAGALTLRLITPVFDDQGRQAGIIVLNLLGEEIRAHIGRLSTEEGMDIWVLDELGVELINVTHPELEGRNTYEYLRQTGDETLVALAEELLAGGRGTAIYLWPESVGGPPVVKKLMAYVPLYPAEGQVWSAGVSVPYETILAMHSQTRDTLLVLGGGMIAAILIGAFLIIRGERRQAAGSLRESEEQLRATLSSMDDLVFTLDENGVFVDYYQPDLTAELYISPQVFIGKPYQEVMPPSVVQPAKAAIETLKSTGAPQRFDYSLMLSGQEKWFSMTISLRRDMSGQFAGITAVARDITERVRIEQALRHERDNLARVFEAMQDGIYIVNQQYDIQYVNPVLEKDFGPYEGHKCYEYFHDQEEVCPWCQSQDVFAGKTVHWEWYSFKNQRTYDLIDTPLKNADGSLSKLEIFRDITERKQAEESLREERDFAESLINTAQTIILVLDVEGRIVRFNPYMEALSGYSLVEVQGQDWFDTFLPAQDHSRIRALFQEAMRDIRTRGNINPIVTRDGRERQIEWNDKTLKDAAGNVVGLLAIGQDITERVQVEEEIKRYTRQLAALHEADLAIAANLDLNTVLTQVLNETQALLNAEAASVLLPDLTDDKLILYLFNNPGGSQESPECRQLIRASTKRP